MSARGARIQTGLDPRSSKIDGPELDITDRDRSVPILPSLYERPNLVSNKASSPSADPNLMEPELMSFYQEGHYPE